MKNFQRFTQASSFADIARNHLHRMIECEERITAIEHQHTDLDTEDGWSYFLYETSDLRREHSEHAAITIVFSAMSAEGYIYDYAARNLSDSFVEKYLDKLDVTSKWVIVPRLITGKPFPTENRSFALLRQLIKERNTLVHAKSSPIEDIGSIERFLAKNGSLDEKARDAIQALDELAKDIQLLDPNEPADFLLAKYEKSEE